MPVRHARSETRGGPPFGRRGRIGKNGSTRSHKASGSNAAAMPVHTTSQEKISSWRFGYTLLGEGQRRPVRTGSGPSSLTAEWSEPVRNHEPANSINVFTPRNF
jgi:hypothetical protein